MAKDETSITDRNFDALAGRIESVTTALQEDAKAVINRSVTARAWLTGYYIVEYEQHGSDRAKYGEGLLKALAKRLGAGRKRYSPIILLSVAYPQIGESPITQLEKTQLFDFSHPATALKNSASLRPCVGNQPRTHPHCEIMGMSHYGIMEFRAARQFHNLIFPQSHYFRIPQ